MTHELLEPVAAGQKRVRILTADDHPLVRQAIRSVLKEQPDFEVVGEAVDGEQAVCLADELLPDVVIMDIAMPKLSGLEATRRIRARHSNTQVLVLTVHTEIEYILEILQAGAAGYLTKEAFGEEVIGAIRGLVAGDTILSTSVFQQVLQHALRYPTKPVPLNTRGKLTMRELQILELITRGMSNKDIAQELELSLRTIKSHLVDIFCKLGVGSRTEAAITALRSGFLNRDAIR